MRYEPGIKRLVGGFSFALALVLPASATLASSLEIKLDGRVISLSQPFGGSIETYFDAPPEAGGFYYDNDNASDVQPFADPGEEHRCGFMGIWPSREHCSELVYRPVQILQGFLAKIESRIKAGFDSAGDTLPKPATASADSTLKPCNRSEPKAREGLPSCYVSFQLPSLKPAPEASLWHHSTRQFASAFTPALDIPARDEWVAATGRTAVGNAGTCYTCDENSMPSGDVSRQSSRGTMPYAKLLTVAVHFPEGELEFSSMVFRN